jgi:hypothetical protein
VRNVVLLAALTCCTLAACSSDAPPATNGRYCSAVNANLAQLNSPSISDSAGIDAAASLYRSITSIAPLAVQKEWATMTSNIEAAATVDPNDPASVQRVADTARSSQQAASAIADYTTKLCGLTLSTPTTTLPAVVETAAP